MDLDDPPARAIKVTDELAPSAVRFSPSFWIFHEGISYDGRGEGPIFNPGRVLALIEFLTDHVG